MIFLTVIAWILFVALTLIFIDGIYLEFSKSEKQREAEELYHRLGDAIGQPTRRTYWNPRMYIAVALWVVAGTFIFW